MRTFDTSRGPTAPAAAEAGAAGPASGPRAASPPAGPGGLGGARPQICALGPTTPAVYQKRCGHSNRARGAGGHAAAGQKLSR